MARSSRTLLRSRSWTGLDCRYDKQIIQCLLVCLGGASRTCTASVKVKLRRTRGKGGSPV
jgi:hypothetical protein